MSPFQHDARATAQVWSEELARLVYVVDIEGWLRQLGAWLGLPIGEFPPSAPARFVHVENKEMGIHFVLHYPFWDSATHCDPRCWTIHQLDFDAASAPLPFDLDKTRETPETARAKLSDDTADFLADRNTVTHFLDDGRAVAVEFDATLVGIKAVHMTRIGGAVRLAD